MEEISRIPDEYIQFLCLHQIQLLELGVPQCKWKCLHKKLRDTIFDACEDFVYSQDLDIDEDDDDDGGGGGQLRVFAKCQMDPGDETHIYLIDHAFTHTLDIAKKTIEEHENLYERLCSIMDIEQDLPKSSKIEIILKEMWKYNSSYTLLDSPDFNSFVRWWFIMDEFGSTIRHAEDPKFAIVPFYYIPDTITYSLVYPIVPVYEGDEVTVCFPRFKNSLSEEMKKILKYPWEKCDLSNIDFNQSEPDFEYLTSGRIIEELPDINVEIPSLSEIKKIKVYTDYPDVSEHLSLSRFYFTNDKSEAHILWLSERVWNYRLLAETPNNTFYVNQFPSEQVLINKDLLAVVCRRSCEGPNFDMLTLNSYPKWLPTTFSLLTELPKFVSYFQNREKRNLDNTWICKPFNLARGLDVFVTNNLDQIIRLTELRPMIASKYITDPVLFPIEDKGLFKMDFRFIVLLKSIQNFELFIYRRFWLRFANKPFSLDDFDDYEKHYTVMNYGDYPLHQMYCHDFIEKFEAYYGSYKWKDIEADIHKMIKEIFIAAAMKEHPAGIGAYSGSRAIYGLDVMLEWDRSQEVPSMTPMIIEVNWMPDCKRACQYYPDFYDDVFSVLFLDEVDDKNVLQL